MCVCVCVCVCVFIYIFFFLHTVKGFHVLLYNSHKLASVISLHTVFSL